MRLNPDNIESILSGLAQREWSWVIAVGVTSVAWFEAFQRCGRPV